jgi:hypothetical protein
LQTVGSSTENATDTVPPSAAAAAGGEVNATTKSPLTGIPQIDYVHDPNLPRELNGYNLTDYPFYDRVPDDIHFKCDGLHDGFYASIPHKCQVKRNPAAMSQQNTETVRATSRRMAAFIQLKKVFL